MLRRLSALAVPVTVAVLVACPTGAPERLPEGEWGGQHIGLVASDTGASIEYDCAAGTITGPLRLASRGEFDWRGVHFPGHGGPARIDERVEAHPARYTGRVNGESMTLTLILLDDSQPPQTFTLTRGANAAVFKCL